MVVTAGEAGAFAYDDKIRHVSATPADTLDPIGTGDAFIAGFIAGNRRDGVGQGLAWGCALAALKRTYRGDISWAGQEELKAVLASSGQDIIR